VIRSDNSDLRQIIDETKEKNRDLTTYKDRLDQRIAINDAKL
jgi:hypothetical protein